ncbi:unnamed protein product, partial [Adineta steineri]
GPSNILYTDGSPEFVAAWDFDNNGKPDLIVINADQTSINVLLGNANGSFQDQMTYTVGSDPSDATVGQ